MVEFSFRVVYISQWLFLFKDEDQVTDQVTDLRRALSESEKRNEEINREFQKLLRLKEVLFEYFVFTC